jgi:hypothetical protein
VERDAQAPDRDSTAAADAPSEPVEEYRRRRDAVLKRLRADAGDDGTSVVPDISREGPTKH